MNLSMARAIYTVYTYTGLGDTVLQSNKESMLKALKHRDIRKSMKELIEVYKEKIEEMESLLEESK
jgi:hypothetical protein